MARSQRKSLRPSVRFEVFKRDGFVCGYCGATPPTVVLEVDHIIAVAAGGGDEIENLLTACHDCNAGKGARPLDGAAPLKTEVRLEIQRESAEQLRQYNAFLLAKREEDTAAIGRLGSYWFRSIDEDEGSLAVGQDRERSLRIFLKHLPEGVIMDAIDIAMARKKPTRVWVDDDAWRYFCGVCWSKIRGDNRRPH